jgi:hypothetical protein
MKEKSKSQWLEKHIEQLKSFPDISAKAQEILIRLTAARDPRLTIKALKAIRTIGVAKLAREANKDQRAKDIGTNLENFRRNIYFIENPSMELQRATIMIDPTAVRRVPYLPIDCTKTFSPEIKELAEKMLDTYESAVKKTAEIDFAKKHTISGIFLKLRGR